MQCFKFMNAFSCQEKFFKNSISNVYQIIHLLKIHILSFFKIYFIYYFWLCWVFIAVCRISLPAASRGYSSLRCTGFSLQWLLLLQSTGSRHAGFSSCSTQVQQLWLMGSRAQAQQLWCMGLLLRGMWDLPGPRIEPMFPALAGRFLTTLPPGKSKIHVLSFIYSFSYYTFSSLQFTIIKKQQ